MSDPEDSHTRADGSTGTVDSHEERPALDRALGGISRRNVLQTGATFGAAGSLSQISAGATADGTVDVLVFSATAGFRHGNIEYGHEQFETAIRDRLADETGKAVNIDILDAPSGNHDFPTDASALTQYDTVVWFNTTGQVLDVEQQAAFEEYIRNGGGYLGIHAAADTHKSGWEWYTGLVGAHFSDHPSPQEATVNVTDRVHPATTELPAKWQVYDEWYDFDRNPRGNVHVLAMLDEDTYDNASMENGRKDHPIAWCHEYEGGRAMYTGRGHTEDAFDEDQFLDHVTHGILWTGGFEAGDATGTVWDHFERETVASGLDSATTLTAAPDGRVFFAERAGTVKVIEDGAVSQILDIDVYTGQEDGLFGLALDPEFEETGWVYLYYSPPDEAIDRSLNRLSRFTMTGGSIDPGSEVQILDVHTQRETCCHAAGNLEFGPDGHLYLATGDDTNPFESEGYSPIDERDGRKNYDAQRTAANTADLRGSLLRIIPHDDGTYSVPDTNLFTTAQGYGEELENGLVRPEIYVMGLRNPFKFDVDTETGTVWLADYGPDAQAWSEYRGPVGLVELNRFDVAHNSGWPYDHGWNYTYRGHDFETKTPGPYFDPDNPVNDSPNNTGLRELPASRAADVWYPQNWEAYSRSRATAPLHPREKPKGNVSTWPQVPAGGAPMGGPVYRFQDLSSSDALPEYYDGKHFFMEWGHGYIKYVTFGEDGDVVDIEPFLPDAEFSAPMEMVVAPDGSLYYLDWGAQTISRITHSGSGENQQDDEEDDVRQPTDSVSVPFGLNTGGSPGVAHSDTPVVIDGVEYQPATDPNGIDGVQATATNGVNASSSDRPIRETDHDALYQTENWGNHLQIDVAVEDGYYDVTLHFAEIFHVAAGQRVFDVSIQGETVVDDFDIAAEAGVAAGAGGDHVALTKSFERVRVVDGVLTIATNTETDNSKFSGFAIEEATPPSEG